MHQSPAMLGWLFFSGATWVTVALGPASVRGTVTTPIALWGAVVAAFVVGTALLVLSRTAWDLPERPAHLLVVLGTLASTSAALGSGPMWVGAVGGFYGYVAAYAFLHFSRLAAIAHLAFAGVMYGVAVTALPIPHPAATWLLVIGIAAGGAGLVGAVAHRLREAWRTEQEAADSMRAIDQMRRTFLQAVSHELRTPLTVVTGFSTTLQRHGHRLSNDQRDALYDRISGAATRLERLLVDLLDIDRIERDGGTASREPAHLPTVVDQAVNQVRTGAGRVRVRVHDVTATLEPAKIERVIVNLVANALKHNDAATTVELTSIIESSGCLELRVSDDGAGIPRQISATLFDPFVQGPTSSALAQPGTGIGLTIVHQFIRLHGGSVHVEDTPGGGATFVVRLPGAVQTLHQPASAPAPAVSTA